MWEVTNQVSAPKIITYSITSLKKSGYLQRCPLPAKNPLQPPPHCPRLFQVSDYCRPIIFRCLDHTPQVFEIGHHLKGASIHTEFPGCDLPLLLRCQAPYLLLHPLPALRSAPMHPIQIPTWHHYISQRSLWVGEVTLLQYHHSVPYMPVPEMYLHVCPCFCPSTAPLNWEGTCYRLCWERHPKLPGIVNPPPSSSFYPVPPLATPFCFWL